MLIQQNISLKPFNSFQIEASARYFVRFANVEEMQEILAYSHEHLREIEKPFILGGGSNVLLLNDLDGMLMKNEIKGIQLLHEDEEYVFVKAGAGENWHSFVQYCIARNWAGLENLSLIPGTVGASPIQNIGAYGVELEDIFWSLEAFHIKDQRLQTFTAADCQFAYRDSVFKKKYNGEYIICSVSFRLKKHPVFHTSYGAINQELEAMGIHELSIQAISEAVIRIRRSKLPDPVLVGNAGSFFKNPEIAVSQFEEIKKRFPEITAYALPDGRMKLAAAWLIEHCGPSERVSWKGYRTGDAGVHDKQSLVLVNYGHAKGGELLALSEEIIRTVKDRFGIQLEREVNIVP